MINRVVPADGLRAAGRALAESIARVRGGARGACGPRAGGFGGRGWGGGKCGGGG